MRKFTSLGLIFSLMACTQNPNASKIKTVDIPQTAVKDQNSIGFCWYYATMGLIETLMLKKTGQSVDLSE
jgi:C1A family cysteine protease